MKLHWICLFSLSLAACSSDEPTKKNNNNTTDNDNTGDNDGGDNDGGLLCETYLGAEDGCDCGCGVDADCAGAGCSEPGCAADACEYCYDADGNDIDCAAPSGWTCDDALWSDFTCTCGCGISDPSCFLGEDCTGDGCVAAGCDECADGGVVGECAAPEGWTCGFSDYYDSYCDCGCGIADTACTEASGGCTDDGCYDLTCDYCWTGGELGGCAPNGWACDPYDYNDGDGSPEFATCDCGCGLVDPDCEGVDNCTDASCGAAGCEACHDGTGAEMTCPTL